jgi:Xaa-Pro aminopeptidase
LRGRANLTALVIAAVAVLSGGASVAENGFYAARRAALMKKMGGGIALVAGAADTRAYAPFRQDNDFYYLTGVETPGAFLLLDAGENRSLLFLAPRDRHEEQWEGARAADGDLRSAMDAVLDFSKLESELQKRV